TYRDSSINSPILNLPPTFELTHVMNRVVHAISRSPAIQVEVIGIQDAASQLALLTNVGLVLDGHRGVVDACEGRRLAATSFAFSVIPCCNATYSCLQK
ncbi:hypothetical protein PILCRDRAFT_829809, partial [Piloderma croceum F 1598]